MNMAQSKNILLIEDDESIRKLLSQLLEMEGFNILTASSIKAGLRILENALIYLVLCDVKLPDGNGLEFVSVIKEKLPLIEIIVMTAYGSIADSVKAIKSGAFDYISKGEDNNRIIPLVNIALDKSMMQHHLRALEQKNNK